MLTKNIYKLLDDPHLLGVKLHSHYVYHCGREEQEKAKKLIESLLKDYSDEKFISLGYDDKRKKLIKELIKLKKEPGWEKIVRKFLKGLKELIEREIGRAEEVQKPKNIKKHVKKELRKLDIYHKSDVVKVKKVKKGVFEVIYLSKRYSPEYPRGWKALKKVPFRIWKDTQFIFMLNFNKGLFVWEYINVHDKYKSQGWGTKMVKLCERLAKDLGFRRFSVEWPNRRFWCRKHGYKVKQSHTLESKDKKYYYSHEGYKESIS